MAGALRITREALAALAINRQRSGLMMLGILIGVASLTVVIVIGQGTQAQVMSLVARHGLDTLMIRPGSAQIDSGLASDRSQVSLTEDDAWAIEASVDNVAQVVPVLHQRGLAVKYGDQSQTTSVFGVTPAWGQVRRFGATEGEFISVDDMQQIRRVCLLGQTVKDTLFGDADPIGQTVRIGNVSFTIKGVLSKKGASARGSDRDNRIVVPFSTAAKRLLARTYLDQIVVQVRDTGHIAQTAGAIRALLRERHGLRPDVAGDFSIREPKALIDAASGAATTLNKLLVAVSAVSLLAGGIVIMNIMLIAVSERTAEIGLRRALGGTPPRYRYAISA